MFIHIGGDIVVRTRDVIAILDVNQLNYQKNTNKLFDTIKTGNQIVKIANEDVKSYVITQNKVYFSPISSLTLMKRATSIL